MLWKDKLDQWSQGIPLTYPKHIHNRFFYETTMCTSTGLTTFKESFITSPLELGSLEEDYSAYQSHINKSTNKYATSFINLDGTVRLVIPIPKRGRKRNFTTIKDFIDNASVTQQRAFWKLAAAVIKEELKIHPCLYISTHGLGVAFMHVRIEVVPKYYRTLKFVHTLHLDDE